MRHLARKQGIVLRNKDISKESFLLSNTEWTLILDETLNERVDLKIQFMQDGDDVAFLKFDEEDTNDLAMKFNNADLILDGLAMLPSNYSGKLYARLNVLTGDAEKDRVLVIVSER